MNKLFIAVALCLLFAAASAQGDDYGTEDRGIQNGDVNMDGAVCMSDSILIIFHLWRDGRDLPCRDAADVDRSGAVDVADVVGGLRHVFFGDLIPDCPISCVQVSEVYYPE
jgi:hypothetical protein|tara:strand:- start:2476 stop:2808 length:333 start_codon:yes stop_codon:yes gene_type:complete